MAVTGIVGPQQIVTNAGARIGDALVLTKPLGTGILTTARKRDAIAPEELDEAVAAMTTLNDRAAEAMLAAGAHAATDITGFGLLGHAENMARASRVRLIIDSTAAPFMARVLELIAAGIVPGGTRHNAETTRPSQISRPPFRTKCASVSQTLKPRADCSSASHTRILRCSLGN
jgi:selenide,water dikinase